MTRCQEVRGPSARRFLYQVQSESQSDISTYLHTLSCMKKCKYQRKLSTCFLISSARTTNRAKYRKRYTDYHAAQKATDFTEADRKSGRTSRLISDVSPIGQCFGFLFVKHMLKFKGLQKHLFTRLVLQYVSLDLAAHVIGSERRVRHFVQENDARTDGDAGFYGDDTRKGFSRLW